MKNKNGITLIALIITIIVMLILVGVTVTVALNGGLFKTAKTATGKTELERDKELLIAAAVGALGQDGKVVYANIQLPEGFTGENGTYTKGDNTFIVDEYGTVSEKQKLPWYELTDEEKEEIENAGGFKDYAWGSGADGYTIYEDSSRDIEIECAYKNGELGAIEIVGAPYAREFWIYGTDFSGVSTPAYSIDMNTWYYMPECREDQAVKYTGEFPITDVSSSGTIYCQSYLDRIIASFNN